MVTYNEIPETELSKITAEETIVEIKRALAWLSENYIDKKTSYKQNNHLYIKFADIVSRLVDKGKEVVEEEDSED
jgi:hypothetical protein